MPQGETTVQWNYEQVAAESSLLGERAVSFVRLFMFMLMALSQVLIAPSLGRALPIDNVMMGAVFTYGSLAIFSVFFLQTRKPNPRRARNIPFIVAIVDFSYIATMGWRSNFLTGSTQPEMAAAACGLILCFSVARFNWYHVAWSTVLACATFLLLSFQNGRQAFVSAPFVVGCFIALGVLIGWTNRRVRRMFIDIRRRDNLSRFLPRQVVERVLDAGDGVLAPVQREVTVLFSDIRDFTELSEKMSPRAVLEFLDGYFGAMTRIVKGHDGIVMKYLGDGMLAAWGVPDENPDHARKAVEAALEMRSSLARMNEKREVPLRVGIGIHTGQVAAGMLGGGEQHEYTVIGDAVNLASRVEGLTKTLKADILATETTWKRLGVELQGPRMGEEKVKGRTEMVVVYGVGVDKVAG